MMRMRCGVARERVSERERVCQARRRASIGLWCIALGDTVYPRHLDSGALQRQVLVPPADFHVSKASWHACGGH